MFAALKKHESFVSLFAFWAISYPAIQAKISHYNSCALRAGLTQSMILGKYFRDHPMCVTRSEDFSI